MLKCSMCVFFSRTNQISTITEIDQPVSNIAHTTTKSSSSGKVQAPSAFATVFCTTPCGFLNAFSEIAWSWLAEQRSSTKSFQSMISFTSLTPADNCRDYFA